MNEDLFRRLQEYHLIQFHLGKCRLDECKECEDIHEYLNPSKKVIIK